MTVLVRQLGGSVAVVIPRAVAREMKLEDGTPLEMSTAGTQIVLRRQGRRLRRPLRRLIAQINPASYRRRKRELAGDPSAGREVW